MTPGELGQAALGTAIGVAIVIGGMVVYYWHKFGPPPRRP